MVQATGRTEYVGLVEDSLAALTTGLAPADYDQIDLTYNAAGDIETVTYRLGGAVVGTLTLSYNGGRLVTVART